MSYVPGYLHDVFISYACADDRPDGLVRHFWTLLTDAIEGEGLRIKQEGSNEGVDVFLDRRTLESGDDLTEQVLTSARSTAVFIALHSLAYLGSTWCQKEAAEFTANFDPRRPKLNGRLFVAALGQRGGPAESPIEALRSRRFRRFFYVHEDGKSFRFDPADPSRRNPDGYTLREEAMRLGGEIATTLKAMREDSPSRVFLAETSAARAPHADDIKKWLQQKQVIVLRASGRGDDWLAKTRSLIHEADLFVDLYEADPTAAAQQQAALAQEAGKACVRWLPRGELSAETAALAMQKTRVVEETLEDFKAALLPLLAKPSERYVPAAPPTLDAPEAEGIDAMVIVVAARKDDPYVRQVEAILEQIKCGHDVMVTEDIIENPDSWTASVLELIKFHDPQVVAFVDGACAGPWRDQRLRSLLMLLDEAAPLAKRALCVFPPVEKPDRRLRLKASQITSIHQPDELKSLLGVAG